MRTQKFTAGKLIFSEGDTGLEAYRIIAGKVEVSIHEEAHKVVLARLGVGEIFGEMAMIEQRPRSATIRALEDLNVEVISREDFDETLQSGGEILIPYLTTIFERLRVTNGRLRTALKDLEERGAKTELYVAESMLAHDGPVVQLLPDSEETNAQSALQARALKHFPFMIGRRGEIAGVGLFAENRLLISDRSPYRVSRSHCQIELKGDKFYVRDNSSRLGTIVNGVSIGGSNRERSAELKPGENALVLGIPNSEIRFKLIV